MLLSKLQCYVSIVLVIGKYLIVFLTGDDVLEISSRAPLLIMASICLPQHLLGN